MIPTAPRVLLCAVLLALPGIARAQTEGVHIHIVRGPPPVAAVAAGNPAPATLAPGAAAAYASTTRPAVTIQIDRSALAPYGRLKIEIRRDRPRHHVWWAWTRAYRDRYGHYGL